MAVVELQLKEFDEEKKKEAKEKIEKKILQTEEGNVCVSMSTRRIQFGVVRVGTPHHQHVVLKNEGEANVYFRVAGELAAFSHARACSSGQQRGRGPGVLHFPAGGEVAKTVGLCPALRRSDGGGGGRNAPDGGVGGRVGGAMPTGGSGEGAVHAERVDPTGVCGCVPAAGVSRCVLCFLQTPEQLRKMTRGLACPSCALQALQACSLPSLFRPFQPLGPPGTQLQLGAPLRLPEGLLRERVKTVQT